LNARAHTIDGVVRDREACDHASGACERASWQSQRTCSASLRACDASSRVRAHATRDFGEGAAPCAARAMDAALALLTAAPAKPLQRTQQRLPHRDRASTELSCVPGTGRRRSAARPSLQPRRLRVEWMRSRLHSTGRASARSRYTEFMELTRTEVDEMLRHADEVRTKLRRATRELKRFGEEAMAGREASRTAGSHDAPASAGHPSDVDRSR
jgi:hypothetical protein